MLRLLKYGLFLLILVLGIIAGLTSVVISDKESSIKNMKSLAFTFSQHNQHDPIPENRNKESNSITTVIFYGVGFFVLLIISGGFYFFIFRTFSKKEESQS